VQPAHGPEPGAVHGPVDPVAFRHVVGRFATGVTVVTTVADGRAHGMTVNSFTSVSLDPLLVLFCCEHDAALHAPVLAAGAWAVSVLAADQQEVAAWFATRAEPGVDQFAGWASRPGPVTAAPLLDGALGWLECRTWATYDGGDHTVILGEVVGLQTGADAAPLLYFRSSYGTTA
jgi:flavin reductase (DIM6/NTAB) family NADH-FMN oxidoreductase RutF